jgi:subtilisin family serine protease
MITRLISGLVLLAFVAAPASAEKKKITKQDDLPRHTYEMSMPASELLASHDAVLALAEEVRKNLESDLETYDIEDKTTLQGIHSNLMTIAILEERWDDALARLEKVRGLEDKEAIRATTGLGTESRIAAIRATGSTDPEVYRDTFRDEYAKRVNALDWNLVADVLQGTKAQMEMVSESLILGLAKEQLDPIVEKSGEVSQPIANQLIGYHDFLSNGLHVKDAVIAVLQDVMDRNKEEKEDIWAARDLDLSGRDGLEPVVVAVWDTGVDVDIFEKLDQVFTNPGEKLDGKDTDGNGFVDDVHGIAFDLHNLPTSGPLYDMSEAERDIPTLQGQAKGLFDMRAAIDSPEAQALRAKMASLGQDEVKGFIEDLTRYTLYSHGTHVAGISVAGNPAADVLYCRLTGDPRMIGEPPTMEDSENMAKAAQSAVQYFRDHGVRVVNMSWVVARSGIEAGLEQHGIGETAEERKEMARQQFDVIRAGLEKAFRSAPDILFVGGAGNSNNDIEFDEFVPPMLRLDNLLIAGAVDQAGEETSFTSFGPTVNVYSNGFEVESYVPGGDRLAFSGTSMASPNVANLAAKLFALDPSLTPQEVVQLIIEGSDEVMAGDQKMQVINPKRSAELLMQKKGEAM